MGRSPLTLAAFATNALEGSEFTSVRPLTSEGSGDFDSVILTTDTDQTLVFRVPRTPEAARKADDEATVLSALSAGVRARLPFEVPTLVGHTEVGNTTARLYEYIPGSTLRSRALKGSGQLCSAVGGAIAAIHSIPSSVVTDFDLPARSAIEVAAGIATTVDRARGTGRLPDPVARRWDAALAADPLWEFTPTVVHGDLSEASFSVADAEVTGVFGWSAFGLGDPAVDLAWVIDLPAIGFDISEAYLIARRDEADACIRQRALLHRELDLARWLLYGVDTGDASTVDDGARMLRALAADIERGAAAPLVPSETQEPAPLQEPAAAAEPGYPDPNDVSDTPSATEEPNPDLSEEPGAQPSTASPTPEEAADEDTSVSSDDDHDDNDSNDGVLISREGVPEYQPVRPANESSED